MPAFNEAQTTMGGNAVSLTDVLRVPYDVGPPGGGLPPASAKKIMSKLERYPGVSLLAIYSNPVQPRNVPIRRPGRRSGRGGAARLRFGPGPGRFDSIIDCAGLRNFPAIGSCAPSVHAVYANTINDMITDNTLTITLPVVSASSSAARADARHLDLGMLLVKTDNASTMEKVRTTLTEFNATVNVGGGITGWQMGYLEPETFGEMAQIRNDDDNNAEDIVLAIVGLTLLGAACSLAVTVGGGIVERKRAFTLLRLSGTSMATLYRVVVLESVLPLLTASLVAAATGIGVALPLVKALPKLGRESQLAWPGSTYYLAMSLGLVIALAVVSCSLPLLGRVTRPDSARFE